MIDLATTPLTDVAQASLEAVGEPQRHSFAPDPVRVMIELARTNFAVFVAATHRPRYKHSTFSAEVCKAVDQFVDDVIAGKRPVLMLTAPPQHGKSSLIARCLPPYLFGRLTNELPAVRIACASYAQGLASRNRRDAQSIMTEPIYREIFPEVSLIGFSGIDNVSDGLEVPHQGWLRGVGVGGALTGFSVDCFAPGTKIDTDAGLIDIENLHLHAKTVKVLSRTHDGKLEYASIKAVGHRQAARLYRITTDAGRVLKVTGNHPIFANGDYTEAAKLAAGDILLCALPNQSNKNCGGLHQTSTTVSVGQTILQQDLHGLGKPHRQQELPRLRLPREMGECGSLPAVPRGVSARTHESSRTIASDVVRDLRRDVHQCVESGRKPLLQQGLQGHCACSTHVGRSKSELSRSRSKISSQANAAQQSGVSLCETGDTRSGRAQMHDMQCDEVAACASYRRKPVSQFVLQFADTVRSVPPAGAPAHGRGYESDIVRMVEVIDGPVTVYDLQVKKNANLFADGILAHNCGIIDDPVKNAEEALSETIQERNRDWYDSVFMTRLQARSGQVIIGTPWSAQDLLAHVRKLHTGQPNFTLLSFPALNDPAEVGYDPAQPAGALVPHLHDEAKLREVKRNISAMWWAAMYQQTPLADVGAIFPRANVQHYRRADLPQKFQRVIMSVDATFKDGATSDYVAVGVWGKTADDRVWLIDKRREKLAFMATAQAIADLRRKHPNIHRIYIEEAANGAALIDMLKKHFPQIEGVPPLGSKEARAHAVSWIWTNNCVMLPDPTETPDIAQWVAEITSFPDVKNDDTVDCMSIALQQLCLRTPIAALITREILAKV